MRQLNRQRGGSERHGEIGKGVPVPRHTLEGCHSTQVIVVANNSGVTGNFKELPVTVVVCQGR